MKAIRFLNTADKLKESSHEADARTSISRSYYAIIHLVKEKLGQEAIEINRNQTHSLHNIFYGCKKDKVKAIGGHISTLQHERIKADYKLFEKVEKKHAEASYKIARKIEAEITAFFKNDDKENIVEQARKFLGTRPN